ncbi:MAG: T9SS type A sorting domain-containing protein, partial [Cyclobacteriaceae bacterium]
IQVIRSKSNKFIRYRLSEPVIVNRKFFVGWKQNTAAVIPVGFDKNTDTGNQIYYNVSGAWEKNTLLSGSRMIRPVFGEGNGTIINEIRNEAKELIYPNPSAGHFRLDHTADSIEVFDLAGRIQNTEQIFTEDSILVHLPSAPDGLYLVRWVSNGQLHTRKLLLKKD